MNSLLRLRVWITSIRGNLWKFGLHYENSLSCYNLHLMGVIIAHISALKSSGEIFKWSLVKYREVLYTAIIHLDILIQVRNVSHISNPLKFTNGGEPLMKSTFSVKLKTWERRVELSYVCHQQWEIRSNEVSQPIISFNWAAPHTLNTSDNANRSPVVQSPPPSAPHQACLNVYKNHSLRCCYGSEPPQQMNFERRALTFC